MANAARELTNQLANFRIASCFSWSQLTYHLMLGTDTDKCHINHSQLFWSARLLVRVYCTTMLDMSELAALCQWLTYPAVRIHWNKWVSWPEYYVMFINQIISIKLQNFSKVCMFSPCSQGVSSTKDPNRKNMQNNRTHVHPWPKVDSSLHLVPGRYKLPTAPRDWSWLHSPLPFSFVFSVLHSASSWFHSSPVFFFIHSPHVSSLITVPL